MPMFQRQTLACLFVIALVGLAAYSNSYDAPFVFDDRHNISENHFTRITKLDGKSLYDAGFKSPSSRRPVANVSFALNYYLGGYHVGGYHLINVMVHLINGMLVFLLVRALLRAPFFLPGSGSGGAAKFPFAGRPPETTVLIPLFAALMFIAHPVQTQSVTYIVQRMNSMAVMFYLLAFLLFLHGRLNRIRLRRWLFYFGALTSWALSMGCKEIAATLPFALLLCEWFLFQDLRLAWLKRSLKYIVPALLLLMGLVLWYTGFNPVDTISQGYGRYRDFTVGERVLTQFRVVVFYITLVLFPHPSRLNLLHHVTTSRHLFDPLTTVLSLLLIAALIVFALVTARQHRLVAFCILWFFGHLVIESSFVGLEMIYEHRLYLPLFGACFMAGYLLFYYLRDYRPWAVAAGTALILLLVTGTYVRNQVWQDAVTLWRDVVKKNPHTFRGYNNLGLALKNAGDLEAAKESLATAIRINPNYFRAPNNMGLVLQAQGRMDEAEKYYADAVRLNPRSAASHHNLGAALASRKQYDEAIGHYRHAIELNPYFSDAYNNLGVALTFKGQLPEAEQAFQKALELDPRSPHAHNNLGLTMDKLNRPDDAQRHYRRALGLDPDFADAHNNLGFHLSKRGLYDEAVRHLREAVRIKPDYRTAQVNLANALAQGGDPGKSVERFQELLASDPENMDAHYNLALALVKLQQRREATHHLREVLRIKPDHGSAHNNLGILLAMDGRTDEAMAHFAEALRINPDDVDAHCNMGVALAGQGQLDAAVSHFREALAVDPDHRDARRNLDTALREMERQKDLRDNPSG